MEPDVYADLLKIIIKTGADDTKAIRRQYSAMQLVGLVLLVLLIFFIRDLHHFGLPINSTFGSEAFLLFYSM